MTVVLSSAWGSRMRSLHLRIGKVLGRVRRQVPALADGFPRNTLRSQAEILIAELHRYCIGRGWHVSQQHSGKSLLHQVIDLVHRGNLDQVRCFGDDVGLSGLGLDREIHAGVGQIIVAVDRGGVDRGLHQFQGERNKVARDHGFQQQPQFCVEAGEAGAQVFVIVGWKIAGVYFNGKRGERSGQREHGAEELLRMSAAYFEEMTENGQCGVNGVEQPETRDIGGREIRERLILLASKAGENRTARRQDLEEAAGNRS